MYSSLLEFVYAAASHLLEDAEHQADLDPFSYPMPAGSPGHKPEAVLQAGFFGAEESLRNGQRF